ncbi:MULTISPECIES: type I polyketide synthase [unclassified Streptomyces]|uniref:type I polyketide synthase n=1 Tax=unclassified Streptomyces TaxID=2593676 RepID=UPI001FAC4AF6|nr:type I polyketide synthase [Streptomyces sp. PBSH9]
MSGSTPRQVPIAVVGVGALVPGATDAAGYWRIVTGGRDLITEVPASRWRVEDHYDPDPAAPDKTYARRGAFLPEVDFDPMAYGVPPANLPATDTSQLLALMVADQVLRDAGGTSGIDRDRTGVVLGAAALELLPHMYGRSQRPAWLAGLRESGLDEAEAQAVCDRIAARFEPWRESTFPGLLGNVVAGRIANRFDLHGVNHTTDAACASSLAALSTAVGELSLDRADLVISGGVDTGNDVGMFLCFSKTPALSPSGDCRPFAEAADGTMLGEAVVMYALKRLSDAERDGDRIHAVIRGIGTSSDGRSTAIYAPLPEGQERALRRAYDEAGYGPETVELVEAHGTGTKAGDTAELAALNAVFGASGRPDGQWCAIGSVKSQIGHTKCAAGAAGLLKAVMALHHKVLPPTVKVERPNPAAAAPHGPFYVNTEARPWVRPAGHPRRAAVSSFGFGGSNFHVTLEEYTPPAVPAPSSSAHADPLARPAPKSAGRPALRHRTASSELVLFGAASPSALVERLPQDGRPLAALARESHAAFSPTARVRLAVVATGTDDLREKYAQALALIRRRPEASFSAPSGTRYAYGESAPGRIGFLFPGQGSQYVGMGAGLAMLAPAAQAVWDRLGSTRFDGRPLHRAVFPPPAFTEEERAARAALLDATEWAQPALAVHALALLAVVRELGLRPDCVAGHSFGELVALHCAGALDAESLVGLARRRGELMREAAATPGAMLAVAADRVRVAEVLAGGGFDDIWPANHNSPRQTVLSGSAAAVERAKSAFSAAGIAARGLSASTAFHSPLVAPAVEPLAAHLRTVTFSEPLIEVYGNTDAAPYPSCPDTVRRRVADHLASPVLFQDQIEAMYAAGVRTFVEVGAGATLTGLVGQILGDREHAAVPMDRPAGAGADTFHAALGQLAVRGVPLDLTPLWTPYASPGTPAKEREPRMTVKISGANYGQLPPSGTPRVEPTHAPDCGPHPDAVPAAAPAPEAAVPARAPVDVPLPPGYVPAAAASQQEFAASHPARTPVDSRPVIGDDRQLAVESIHRQTAETHLACQRLLTDSHMAFLRMTETTLAALLGAPVPGAVPDMAAPAPLPLPRSAGPLDVPAGLAAPAPAVAPAAPVAPAAVLGAATPWRVPEASAPPEGDAVRPSAPDSAPPPEPPARDASAPDPSASELSPPQLSPSELSPSELSPSELEELLLSVVADLTGYPTAMLHVDMDLEADLGVDSIKRVEILSAVRRRVGDVAAGDAGRLGKLRTLREITAALASGARTAGAAPEPDVPAVPAPRADAFEASPAEAREDAPISTTVDVPAVRGGGSERAAEDAAADGWTPLTRLVPRMVESPASGLATAGLLDGPVVVSGEDVAGCPVVGLVARKLAERGVDATAVAEVPEGARGVIHLGGLSANGTPDEAREVHGSALRAARAMAPRAAGGGGLFVTVQDTGGDFGLGGHTPGRAWLGGTAGLARTAAKEWPDTQVRVLDCERGGRDDEEVADAIVSELLEGGADTEVGLRADGTRALLRMVPRPLTPGGAPRVGEDSVIVATGGARGVTAAALLDLARTHRPRIVLLGRTEAAAEPEGLASATDERALTRLLAERAGDAEGSSPAGIAEEARRILAAREVRATLAGLEAAGSPARYVRVDVRDADALTAALHDVRATWGPVTGIVHGAGVLADKRIADKSDEQAELVMATKVEGLRALLTATADDPLNTILLFSSVAAVFGNAGQSDYAMANEILQQVASAEQARRPGCLVRCVAWGPWQGGMVTPALAAHFGRSGVPLIPPAQGAAACTAELDGAVGEARVVLTAGDGPAAADGRLRAQVLVSSDTLPQLADHAPAGVPVLPVALVLNWFAGAAAAWLPAEGQLVLRDLRVYRKYDLPELEGVGHRLTVLGSRGAPGSPAGLEAELRGEEGPAHFRAVVDTGDGAPGPSSWDTPADLKPLDVTAPYDGGVLFHGPRFHALREVRGVSEHGAEATVSGLRSLGWRGGHGPLDPAAVDGALQLALLWGEKVLGTATLPMSVAECRVYRRGPVDDAVRCVVRGRKAHDTGARCDAALIGPGGSVLLELTGVELVSRPS